MTACCDNCKDVFTVWVKTGKGRVLVEPQSRIMLRDNDNNGNHQFLPLTSGNNGLYHYCGGKLHLYPDYQLARI
jgi:hypothetical protein